jgi:subtilase family serine protease
VVGVAFLVDGQYITFGNSAPIPAGETRTIRAVSAWQALAGQHQLTAVVDDVNRYPELSETNNRFVMAFQVFRRDEISLPDSTVNQLGFEKNGAGQIVLTATVANIGRVKTPDVVGVAFFVDGQYRTYGVTQPMAPNATEVIRAVQPLSLSGRHTITAIVDDVNRYDELSHQNNALTREFTFG